jgi:hypothetical protein
MWRKKKWIIIAGVAAVVILVIGILGGVAYAQTTPVPTGTDSGKTLMGRVAAILNIDQKTVENAFAKAEKDIRSEAEKARLNKMVQDGKLTQDQADKYQSWVDSRPDVPVNMGVGPGPGPKGRMRGFQGGVPCFPGQMGAIPQFPNPTIK